MPYRSDPSVAAMQQNAEAAARGELATQVTVAAAGATQGDATAITPGTALVIITATTSAQGVRLPPIAQAGDGIRVYADLLLNNKVYPATGDAIGAGAANAAFVLTVARGAILRAKDTTTWMVLAGTGA